MSSSSTRQSTLEEKKLTKLLIDHVLPPFSKSLKLQALVVFQADQEKMNCLLVNETFKKGPNDCLVECGHSNSDFSDSGIMDSSILPSDLSNGLDNSLKSSVGNISPHLSRRKRKLSRPCKIYQSTAADVIMTTVHSNCADTSTAITKIDTTNNAVSTSAISSMHLPVVDHAIVNHISPTPALLTPTFSEGLPNKSNVITELNRKTMDIQIEGKNESPSGVFLPVSAVTLLPHVGVFSLPVTVLSTVPRPILPRLSTDRQGSHLPDNCDQLRSCGLSMPISYMTSNFPHQTCALKADTVATTSSTINSTIQPTTFHFAAVTSSNSITASTITNSSPPLATTSAVEAGEVVNRRYTKSFVCNQCRKAFGSLSHLCEHTFAVHKAFRCTICRTQFTQRSNLQRHSLRHVGFKPFLCKLCDRAYYRKDHLVRHIELTHPGSDPRANLTVKLSSAECLDYLDQLNRQNDNAGVEQAQILCHSIPPNSLSLGHVETKQSLTTSKPFIEPIKVEPPTQRDLDNGKTDICLSTTSVGIDS